MLYNSLRVRNLDNNRQYFVNASAIILFFIAIHALVVLFYLTKSNNELTWEECNVTRYDVWKVFRDNLDVNRDGIIDTDECIKRWDDFFNDPEDNKTVNVLVDYIFSFSETTVKFCAELAVLCDSDNDERITEIDFNNTETTCIKTCRSAIRGVYTLQQLNKKNPLVYFFVFFLEW